MHKEVVTYTDWNGTERTEEFYFNLTEQELVKMDIQHSSALRDKIERITKAKEQKEILDLFEEIVYQAYGKKSEDGRRFMKSKEIKDDFIETPAYSIIYMKLASDADAASKFINETIQRPKSQPVADVTSIADR